MAWELILYDTAAGRCPVCDYFDGLPATEMVALANDLLVLERGGVTLGMPLVKHLRGRVYELRSPGPHMQHRVLYIARSGQKLLLLHAFTKKTQQTPPREITVAEQRLGDWESRYGEQQ